VDAGDLTGWGKWDPSLTSIPPKFLARFADFRVGLVAMIRFFEESALESSQDTALNAFAFGRPVPK
jgi:hypothetical protein